MLFYRNSTNLSVSRDDVVRKVNEFFDGFTSLENKLIIISAVAAAGFWASSWWFGITIPWAVACTAITTVCAIGSSRIASEKSQNEIPNSVSLNEMLSEIQKLEKDLREIQSGVKTIKFLVWVTIEASSWACREAKVINFMLEELLAKIFDWGVNQIIDAVKKLNL